jgi:hypothetical protein
MLPVTWPINRREATHLGAKCLGLIPTEIALVIVMILCVAMVVWLLLVR